MKFTQIINSFLRSGIDIRAPKSALPTIILTMMLTVIANPTSAADLRAAIEDDYASNLEGLFKHLHQNPELSLISKFGRIEAY